MYIYIFMLNGVKFFKFYSTGDWSIYSCFVQNNSGNRVSFKWIECKYLFYIPLFLYYPPLVGEQSEGSNSAVLVQDFGCQIDQLAKCCHKVCKFGHIWLPKQLYSLLMGLSQILWKDSRYLFKFHYVPLKYLLLVFGN